MQSYTKYLNLNQGRQANDFSDLLEIDTNIMEKLEDLYVDVNGIDLWLGMAAERSMAGSKVGETQGCKCTLILKCEQTFSLVY